MRTYGSGNHCISAPPHGFLTICFKQFSTQLKAFAAPLHKKGCKQRWQWGKGTAQLLPALRSTLRAVGCQATMPTLFEWPSKITTGSVRERVSPLSGICHTCWKRERGPIFQYHIYCDHLVWRLVLHKQNIQWSLDKMQNNMKRLCTVVFKM